MKMNKEICIELNGIKVGDIVRYEDFYGYVAVINPRTDDLGQDYLLRLKNYEGHNGGNKENWYPKNERKKEENNCWWARKNELEVIHNKPLTQKFIEWNKKYNINKSTKKKSKYIYLCPKCEDEITQEKDSVSPGYFGSCSRCDEDFFKEEVIKKLNI